MVEFSVVLYDQFIAHISSWARKANFLTGRCLDELKIPSSSWRIRYSSGVSDPDYGRISRLRLILLNPAAHGGFAKIHICGTVKPFSSAISAYAA